MSHLALQSRVAQFDLFISDGYRNRLFGPDEIDTPLSSCYPRIEQIPVKQFEMGCVDGDDHAGTLASLILVNRNGIS